MKAEAKGIFSEEVEDALERIEVKPEVKIEEDFVEEEDAEGNNDEDYMASLVDPQSTDIPNTVILG